MGAKWTETNADEWAAKIASFHPIMKQEVKKALEKNAIEFETKLRASVPKDHGDLEGTIEVKWGEGDGKFVSDKELSVTISIGNKDVPYVAAVEFGHFDPKKGAGSHVPPHPFFYPLVRVLRKKFKNRLKRADKKAAVAIADIKNDSGSDE